MKTRDSALALGSLIAAAAITSAAGCADDGLIYLADDACRPLEIDGAAYPQYESYEACMMALYGSRTGSNPAPGGAFGQRGCVPTTNPNDPDPSPGGVDPISWTPAQARERV